MSMSVKTNQLTGPAVTGNSATTDPGFQPKALMLWNGLQTASGAVADAQFNLGFASSTTTEVNASYNSDDNLASSDVVRCYTSAVDIIRTCTAGAATVNIAASLNSFNATGFTPNWGTLTTVSPLFNYLALGGADITNVKSGTITAATSGATQAVTGVGFQPDIVFFFAISQTGAGQANNTNQYSVGVATALSQWVAFHKSQHNQVTMNTSRGFMNNRCIVQQSASANTTVDERSLASMDSDGFTFNIDTQGGTAFLMGYMAIKGGQWKVGTETQNTSTGTKATTGVGFTPKGLVLASVCDTQTSGTQDHARLCFGASTGPSNNAAVWTGDQDGSADSIANTIMSSNKCLVLATEATGASPTTNAEAALSSFDSDGFTLDWTTADATARVFGYVAFGDSAVAANFFQMF